MGTLSKTTLPFEIELQESPITDGPGWGELVPVGERGNLCTFCDRTCSPTQDPLPQMWSWSKGASMGEWDKVYGLDSRDLEN